MSSFPTVTVVFVMVSYCILFRIHTYIPSFAYFTSLFVCNEVTFEISATLK